MSSEEHFRSIVKLKDTITTIDLGAALRALTRQFSQSNTFDALKLLRNPELKQDFISFFEIIEKHLDIVEPSNLHEFTNLFNVFRQNRVEFFINGRLKGKLIKRINTIFTEPEFAAEVNQLSLDNVTKILSDAIHFGNVNVVSTRVEELISKKEGL